MLETKQVFITEEEYLAGELESDIKHEYADGKIYAMAGASKNHQRIVVIMTRQLGNFWIILRVNLFHLILKLKWVAGFFILM